MAKRAARSRRAVDVDRDPRLAARLDGTPTTTPTPGPYAAASCRADSPPAARTAAGAGCSRRAQHVVDVRLAVAVAVEHARAGAAGRRQCTISTRSRTSVKPSRLKSQSGMAQMRAGGTYTSSDESPVVAMIEQRGRDAVSVRAQQHGHEHVGAGGCSRRAAPTRQPEHGNPASHRRRARNRRAVENITNRAPASVGST